LTATVAAVSDAFPPVGDLSPPSAPSGRPEFLEPKYLIALVIGAVLVLIAGLIAVARGGGDDAPITAQATTSSVTPTTRVLTTSPIPLPSTTTTSTSTSTTSSTSTTTTSTTPPAPAVADAGADLAVDAGGAVTLTALDLSDANQSVVWRQVGGPDVTDGRGRLVGAEATFDAPGSPTTLRFEMSVTGRGGDVATDDLRVDVYEQADRVLFVDGVAGSKSGDGSRDRPYRDLSAAISEADARGDGTDVYIRAVDSTYGVDAEIRNGSSLYGGYDADWVRTGDRPALLSGRLSFVGKRPIILASIDLRGGGDAEAVLAVSGAGSARLEDSTVRAVDSTTGTNIAVRIQGVPSVAIVRSEIYGASAGAGADAVALATPDPPLVAGAKGNDASGRTGGAALVGAGGTRGGDGGSGLADGSDGGDGAPGGSAGEDGSPGAGGLGGVPGVSGAGGVGVGTDTLTGTSGMPGLPGGSGGSGGGGGGGAGLILHDGGGGGGGGGGGQGGPGGAGGTGGHASIALFIADVARFELSNSIVQGGAGGQGGLGGNPLNGAQGGDGGRGGLGVSSFLDTAGAGGNGGGGGAGGQGGWGGGGAGGPSIGLLTVDVGSAVVSKTTIRAGQGGNGGAGGLASAGGDPGEDGGARGVGLGPARGAVAAQSSGGDSIGWRDDGAANRDIAGSTIRAGVAGAAGGEGGPAGKALDTAF
jgi:hypothetical protein